ncbi:hypothetical protein ABZ470_26405 [Streptosporangium sp. NPDC020072]|uniref:hypothetical protein n=1 Tax=Streptosporangium sp. NPDC020072 TaxID=3154788 RepID=UPI003435B75C
MADFQFNVSKGRAVELYRRVKIGDPAGSVLLVVALAAAGVEPDAVLRDKDTLADVLSGSTEAANAGYARKVLGGASLDIVTPDDANDWVDLTLPDQTWANVQAGTDWSKLLICYRPGAAVTDADVTPLTAHDFPIRPDGSNVVAQVDPSGFFRAV